MKKVLMFVLASMMALVMIMSVSANGKQEEGSAAGSSDKVAAAMDSGPQRGGSLVVAKSGKLSSGGFDIAKINNPTADGFITSQIFESLLGRDSDDNIVPMLAKSWHYADENYHFVVELRDDVHFHDGTLLNAEAVKANYDYYLQDKFSSSYVMRDIKNVESVDVIDDFTIQVNLSRPDSTMEIALSGISGMMMSPASISKGVAATEPCGTGPFMLSEYIEGDHVTLVANKNYYRDGEDGSPLPYLDEIVFKFIVDDSVKTVNLQSGDIDGVDLNSSFNSVITLQNTNNINMYQSTSVDTYFITFIMNNKALEDARVRKAFSYAINRQELIDVILEGYGVISPFLARDGQWFYSDYTPGNDYDPAKAKALLAEAGYPDGVKLRLCSIAREPDNTFVQLIQEQVKASGFEIQIDAMERTAWVDLIVKNDGGETADLAIARVGNTGVDPCRQYQPSLDYADKRNPAIEPLQQILNESKRIFSMEERAESLFDFQQAFLDNYVSVYLCQKPIYSSYIDKVHNIEYYSYGSTKFDEVWMEQ